MTSPEIIQRVGYSCKTIFPDDKKLTQDHNFRSTTLSHLQRLDTVSRNEKLTDIIRHNLSALALVIGNMDNLPAGRRMFRIGSDFLPMWDHEIAADLYRDLDMVEVLSDRLLDIGDLARELDVRLSFHPDQFVVIASPNPEVANRGIYHIERVAGIASMMGYSGWHDHGFAINIHAGAASVTMSEIREVIRTRLSDNARNFLTIENDEFSHGIDQLCELKDDVAIVFDIHHDWISEGSYVGPWSHIARDVIDSWRGVRPKMHLAMSREHLIPEDFDKSRVLNLEGLLAAGLTKSKLRAHSDTPWHTSILDYTRQFWDRFDIMWEGKDKILGQEIIYNHFTNNDNNNDRS